MKKFLALVMVCVMVLFALAACASDDTEKALTDSTWTLSKLVDKDGKEKDVAAYAKQLGLKKNMIESSFTFNEKGSLTANLGGAQRSGKYEIDGTTVKVTVGESKYEMTYDEDKGTLSTEKKKDEGMQLVFTKE